MNISTEGDPITKFIFATGIECSYPTITTHHGTRVRIDKLESSFHYQHWRTDLELVRELDITFPRYGPPYYKVHLSSDRHEWEFTDKVFSYMRELEIVPIADLCHFGVPDWIGDFHS